MKSVISPYHDDGVAGQVEPIEFGDHFSDLGIHVAHAGIIAMHQLAFEFDGVVLVPAWHGGIHGDFPATLVSNLGRTCGVVLVAGKRQLGGIVLIPVFPGGTEGEVGPDETARHEKGVPAFLRGPKPLDRFGRHSSVGVVLVAGLRGLEGGAPGQGMNAVKLLVCEVGFLPGELAALRARGIEILDNLVVEVWHTEGFGVALIPVTDVENLAH